MAEARKTLAGLVALDTLAPREVFEEAIAAYCAETNVVLPETGKYYNLYAQNAKGEMAYLAVKDGRVELTADAQEAKAFKVVPGYTENSVKLKTADGHRAPCAAGQERVFGNF